MTIRRLLPFAFWGALLFAFVMAVLPQPPQLPGQPLDKVQHILAFAVLAGLAAAAYPRASLMKILLLLSAFGALIEFAQMIPALHRDGDWVDWAADVMAAGTILLLVALTRKRSER
jgi:Na+/H+-dicarboxylate symporter